MSTRRINRRRFLQTTGAAAGLAGVGQLALPRRASGDEPQRGPTKVALVFSPEDEVATSEPAQWAAAELCAALAARGVAARCSNVDEVASDERCVKFRGGYYSWREVEKPDERQLALSPMQKDSRPGTIAWGRDACGLMYALLELSDRVIYADEPLAALEIPQPLVEQPANKVRGIGRAFASNVEDLPWFHDQEQWRDYLTMLARQRFNRFTLHLGLGYDFTREIRDSYFHFPYPFLVSPSGYNVRAVGLPDDERARNLASLKFMSDEAARRGIDFWLALWTQAYEFTDSPEINYRFEGLSSANHAPYCRDALAALLEACPAIRGITIRTHGESGVAEGSDDFWDVLFAGFKNRRKVVIDLHPKGLDQKMIDTALATGMPVQVSPKFWAEHMGLPYHQASIRELEMPPRNKQDAGFFAKSSGSRRFLRYGYGDLLSEKRPYEVVYRIWPGTQRLLLWGDPAMAAAYSRQGSFCGSQGIEVFEPLFFKGKKGTGQPGSRTAYADAALIPAHDWEKYRYEFCLWGRLLYNPEAEPETWRRMLHAAWGDATQQADGALAAASRVLPLVTTAHLPSAANNNFWPEMYQNMSILDETAPAPYKDTPTPKRFGTVSPLDPVLFYGVEEFAADLSKGQVSGRYSPLEVAQWLERLSQRAEEQLRLAQQKQKVTSADARRLAIDVEMQIGLGRFFAHKLRAGVFYAMAQRGAGRSALEQAISEYRAAGEAWSALSKRASGVYVADVTFGHEAQQRGNWSDRVPALEADIAAMEKLRDQPLGEGNAPQTAELPFSAPERPTIALRHQPPGRFRAGDAVALVLATETSEAARRIASVQLHYRPVNQAARFKSAPMQAAGGEWRFEIAGEETRSEFPLQYFFELRDRAGHAWLHPALDASLCNEPYFVVRQV